MIERVIEYFKDRTGHNVLTITYYPCTRPKECNLSHVLDWIGLGCLYLFMYNARRADLKFRLLARLLGGDGMA
jgi:hypothetical protein